MPLLRINLFQQRVLAITTVLAILAGLWFLQDYLILAIVAGIVALLFNPLYLWLIKKGRSKGQASLLTFLASVFAVIIPLIIVVTVTVFQVNKLADTVAAGNYSVDLTQLANEIINYINSMFDKLGISASLSVDNIASSLSSAAEEFGKRIVEGIVSSITGFFGFITAAIIYIYVFMSLLNNQEKILSTLKKLNPLGDEISEVYFSRTSAMTKATIRGQFIIALCQGTESAAVLALAGLPDLFFFFWLLLTVLSVVPLGAGIVTIPIGILMILTGNIWQGVLVIANHLLIVTNIDNVLRPRLVPVHARLDSALMILAVFAGIGFFGFLGIVLGPVIMILIVTTIQMYLEVFKNTESISRSKSDAKHTTLLKRAKFWRKTRKM